jgi:cephalosporin hydroxylase
MEMSKVQVVVELGVESGGSALWFADRVRALSGPKESRGAYPAVIGVDINCTPTREAIERANEREVFLVEGDLNSKRVIDQVRTMVAGRRALIVEDAAHTYDCTFNALKNYWNMTQVGCWLVVEDGMVDDDELRFADWIPRGVTSAVDQFLSTGAGAYFERHHIAPYGLTFAPAGWLCRVR